MLSSGQTAAFARIYKSERVFREWLEAELAKQKTILVSMTDERMFRVAQGRAQAIQQVLDMLAECGAKHPG